MLAAIGGLIGRGASSGDRKHRKEYEERALRGREDLQAPEISQLEQREIDRSMYTGMPSNFGGRDFEDEALAGMAEEARSGGLGAQGQLSMEQARLQSAAQGNRANAAIQANAARRGLGGNAALVGQQVAQQGANQNASLAGMQAAASAENRRLGATQALGGMAGAAEGRRSQQAMERARQLDAANRFQANLAYQTDVANRGLQQQSFQNQMGLADRLYDAQLTRAGQYGRDADATAAMWGNIGQGIEDVAISGAQMYMGMPPTAAFGGSKAQGSAGTAPAQSNAFSGATVQAAPIQSQYDFMNPNWWDYTG